MANVTVAWAQGRTAADAEVATIQAEDEEVVIVARIEAEKTSEDEFRVDFS